MINKYTVSYESPMGRWLGQISVDGTILDFENICKKLDERDRLYNAVKTWVEWWKYNGVNKDLFGEPEENFIPHHVFCNYSRDNGNGEGRCNCGGANLLSIYNAIEEDVREPLTPYDKLQEENEKLKNKIKEYEEWFEDTRLNMDLST